MGNLSERYHLGDLGVDGRIILKWIFEEWNGSMGCIDLLRIGANSGFL